MGTNSMHSTQILAIQACVRDNWTKAVKHALHEDPQNVSEAYSWAYSKADKEEARDTNLRGEIQQFKHRHDGLLTLNTNKMILDEQGHNCSFSVRNITLFG